MKTKTSILLALSFLCFSFVTTAQRGVTIAYIDMEYILESVPDYREAQTQLTGKVQRWKQDIERMQNEIDQMKLDLANERVLLTHELIEEREEEVQIKEDELSKYQQNRFGPNGDLMIQRRQLVQPIQDQVFNIIQDIGENRKYDFIFDKSADVVMLFANKRHDISDLVLRSIERAGRRVEAQTKKEQREIERQEQQDMKEKKVDTEREKEIEKRKQEREQEMESRKNEREEMMKKRQTERDSIRDAKMKERQERQEQMRKEREERRDSILDARNKGKD